MTVVTLDRCPKCAAVLRQRTHEQNALLHATLGDIAAQVDWPRGSGQKLDIEAWKRLFTYAWERSEGRSVEIYPALDGHGMDIVVRHTHRMSKEQLSSLCEYVIAQGVEWGVRWSREAA